MSERSSASLTVEDGEKTDVPAKRRRIANLYDAVAGRVSTNGFIPLVPHHSIYRDTLSSNLTPIRPDEVLYRLKQAPQRFEEFDPYFANEDVAGSLPESDLLKAIHAYSSDFYAAATSDRGSCDWRTMDETALLAMGILLEEAAQESLEGTGDLAFIEGENDEEIAESPFSVIEKRPPRARAKSEKRSPEVDDETSDTSRPRRKKRKITTESPKTNDGV